MQAFFSLAPVRPMLRHMYTWVLMICNLLRCRVNEREETVVTEMAKVKIQACKFTAVITDDSVLLCHDETDNELIF